MLVVSNVSVVSSAQVFRLRVYSEDEGRMSLQKAFTNLLETHVSLKIRIFKLGIDFQ
jgi:hypothetical protein